VLPDTQVYLNDDSPQPASADRFRAQIDWLVENAEAERIVFATHVGDLVQNPDRVTEWERAEPMMSDLDASGLPYAIAPGNHDLEPGTEPGLFDQYFPPERYDGAAWYRGHHVPSGNRASVQQVTVGDTRLLFVHLRHLDPTYGDPTEMLSWAREVLLAHPAHLAVVTTHEFTGVDGGILYDNLVDTLQDSCNVVAVFSGHRFGAAQGTFTDSCDRTIVHMLTNYQGTDGGGNGFMRQVEINRGDLTASSTVFSPVLETELTGPDERFSVALAPPARLFGDVDESGDLTTADALAVLEELVGLGPSPFDDRVADLNGNGVIDVADALRLAG